MKKIIVFCLAVVLSLTFGIFTISCADAHSHTYTEEWSYDNDYHWHKCIATETCVAMTKHAPHTYEYEYVEENDVVYKISTCSVCGFSQKTVDEHEHEFSNDWNCDDTHHWHDCTVHELCEEISNYEEHEYDEGEITTEPTATTTGEKLCTCTVCGKTKTFEVPALGVTVSTYDELVTALNNGGKINLANDITTSETLAIKANTIINGNNYTLTYTGSNRVIDVAKNYVGASLTLTDLDVYASASFCERGVNYNTSGTLTLNNVTISGANLNYAINFPANCSNATVLINDSTLTSFITFNVWGTNVDAIINNSYLYSVGSKTTDYGCCIAVNTDGTKSADNCTIAINGGVCSALLEDGTTPAIAIRNDAQNSTVATNGTEVTGTTNEPSVAGVMYPPQEYFYSYFNLQDAVNKSTLDVANGYETSIVVLFRDITLDELTIDTNVTIDLNGHTLTVTTLTNPNGALIITGNGTFNDVDYTE